MSDVATPVDLSRIQATSDGDLAFERELCDVFLEDNAPRMQRLAAHVQRRELALARREAHTLKGSSANVGATALSKHAQRLEAASAQEDAATATAAMTAALDEWTRVDAFLRAYVQKISG